MKRFGAMLATVFFICAVMMLSQRGRAANFVSVQSGPWDSPSTWGTGNVTPGPQDNVTISPGHTVSLPAFSDGRSCNDLTISANGELSPLNTSLTINGSALLEGTVSSGGFLALKGSSFIHNGSLASTVGFNGTTQTFTGLGSWPLLVISGGSITSPATATTNFSGFLQVQTGGTLLLNNPLTFTGLFSNGGGIISGNAALQTQGTSTIGAGASTVGGVPVPLFTAPIKVLSGTTTASGFFDGPVEVSSGATLNIVPTSAETSTQINRDITVGGTMTGPLLIFRGSAFANNGLVATNVFFQGTSQTITGTGKFLSNVRVFSGSTVTLGSDHKMENLIINASGTVDISSRTLSLSSEFSALVNGGTLITTASTVIYNGTSAQFLGGSNVGYNNLTIDNPSGVFITGNETVNGVLALNRGDLTISFGSVLTMPASASSTGSGDVIGNVRRTGFTLGSPLSFGSPFNTIRFDSVAVPADVTVNLTKQAPSSFPTAITRTYNIAANGGSGYSATVRLHYLDSEIRVNNESTLGLWRFDGMDWVPQGRTAFNSILNWVERSGVTNFSQWTLASGSMALTHILTNRGGDTGTVSTVIHGSGFEGGATVRLTKPGQQDIVGMPAGVEENGRTIATTFDLTAKSRGLWNLVVVNPTGTTAILEEAFTIEQGRAAQVWVDIIGRDFIRRGQPQSYTIVYGNRGNTDAYGVSIWIGGIPKDVDVSVDTEITPPPQQPGQPPIDWNQVPVYVETDTEKRVPLIVPVVPPGKTGEIRITVTPPSLESYQMEAWVNPSHISSLRDEALSVTDCVLSVNNLILRLLGLVPGGSCLQETAGFLRDLYFDRIHEAVHEQRWGKAESPVTSWSQLLVDVLALGAHCLGKELPGSQIWEAGQVIIAGLDVFQDCQEVFSRLSEKTFPVQVVTSIDPNDKVGPSGEGASRYISAQEPLRYTIFFENLQGATAPAQRVDLSDLLDASKLDMSTFSLGTIAFGKKRLIPAAGSNEFTTDVDLRPNKNLLVRVEARLDADTGIITWRFTSIDPLTGQPPEDPLAGFLPPNITPPEGEGSVFFTVMPKEGINTGTQVRNRARIVFDANAPIDTPEWFNTIDNAKPTSQVLPLASPQCASFQVNWSGSDAGAGILDYTVFVSENNGPFTVWESNTSETSALFTGRAGVTYSFYTLARDRTGNVEEAPASADALVTVNDAQAPVITGAGVDKPSLWPPDHKMVDVTVNYNVTDNCDTSSKIICMLSVTSNEPINGTGDGDTAPDWEIVDTHHVRLRAERSGNGMGRVYTITITCMDSLSNSSMTTVTVVVPKNRS